MRSIYLICDLLCLNSPLFGQNRMNGNEDEWGIEPETKMQSVQIKGCNNCGKCKQGTLNLSMNESAILRDFPAKMSLANITIYQMIFFC